MNTPHYTEYKILSLSEGAIGTIFLGSSALPIKKIEKILNDEAQEGWQVVFQVVEFKRMALFWQRETMILTLGR